MFNIRLSAIFYIEKATRTQINHFTEIFHTRYELAQCNGAEDNDVVVSILCEREWSSFAVALLLLTNKQADAVFFRFDDERGRRGVVLYCLCKFAGRTDVSYLKYYYVLIYDVLLLTGRPCPFGV